ncbi:MAG: hypothetical protein GC191_11500 [Azospirillum sp.]|nr:hypothetical protein [Azospirillum sp.]
MVEDLIAEIDRRRSCTCPGSRFGLWSDDTPPAERACRLRALRMAVRLLAGPAGSAADAALAAAESDPTAIGAAVDAIDRLPSRIMRSVLATYSALNRPVRP